MQETKSFVEFISKIGFFKLMYLYLFKHNELNELLTKVQSNAINEVSTKLTEKENYIVFLEEQIKEYRNDAIRRRNSVLHVLDTCIINATNFGNLLYELEKSGETIVLTSVVRRELNSIQFYNCHSKNNAKKLLAHAAKNDTQYLNVRIDNKTLRSGDEEILQYMLKQSFYDTVILHSCDKNFILEARENGVKAIYYRSRNQNNMSSANSTIHSIKEHLHFANGKLSISNLYNKTTFIKVVSKEGFSYASLDVKLKIGDNILLITKCSNNTYLFEHFIVKSYDKEECLQSVLEKRLNDLDTKFVFSEDEEFFQQYKKMYNDFIRIYKRLH